MKRINNVFISINNYLFGIVMIFGILICNQSCIEPYEGAVDSFEDVLVINAIVTNELKRQEIYLTRSYRFEDEEPPLETGATVSIRTDDGFDFGFEETEPGVYKSIQAFAAQLDKAYTLHIMTESGREYASRPMELPVASTSIDDMAANRIINDDGEEGISIDINSFDPTGSSKYYRHDFIETFKIIAPLWSPFDAVFEIEGLNEYSIPVILREQEERTCYGTNKSTAINVFSTLALAEDRLQNYSVRFINRDDYILTYRYSILVRQYVQSPETFAYYDILKGLTQSSTTVFSEDQPGFLAGNVTSVTNPNENVAGFFEVSTVAEERLFFSWDDFFPGEDLPPHIIQCLFQKPSSSGTIGTRNLVNIIRENKMRFYDFNTNPQPGEGEYIMVLPECGDCTTLGSNIIPDFWIE
ncbi:DUF4249 domain-containing protein [Winogradskyella sp. PE311]|uniref:DUF4249 domain-containing protein n=1 Tax=Winogradskyella sp. PE311 TaxID=3366943 RepID=UPI00398130D2